MSEVVVERFARNVLHDVVDASVGFSRLVDGDDAGVPDLREHADLAFEPGPLPIAGERSAEHQLDGDGAPGAVLDGLIDRALPTPVDLAEDGVAGDPDALGVEFCGVPLAARCSGLRERLGDEILIAPLLVRFFVFGHDQPSKLKSCEAEPSSLRSASWARERSM